MNRIVIDCTTGIASLVELSPEEELDAQARSAAEAADPIRAQILIDAAAQAAAKSDAVVQYLLDHTPAEVEAYVQANVTDLSSARQMMKKFGVALCALARQGLR